MAETIHTAGAIFRVTQKLARWNGVEALLSPEKEGDVDVDLLHEKVAIVVVLTAAAKQKSKRALRTSDMFLMKLSMGLVSRSDAKGGVDTHDLSLFRDGISLRLGCEMR